MTIATTTKFCFIHRVTGKKYLVGAYSRDEATEMVAQICGDFNFDEGLIEDLPQEYQ